jgi:cell division septum initiation protein DivIVA
MGTHTNFNFQLPGKDRWLQRRRSTVTDKEFKQLTRAQLIDVIYQLQLQVDSLTGRNQELEKALEDRRIRIQNAGNIAEAALVLNDCFRNAQNAAAQYLSEIEAIRREADGEREQILAAAREEAEAILREAEAERRRYLESARAEAEGILSVGKKMRLNMDAAIEAILEEHGQKQADTGDGE